MSAPAAAFWRELAAALGDGHAVFLALVASATEHSPGTAGARLFLAADGRRRGTIGGGVMELRVVERARALLRRPAALVERVELVHRRDLAGEDGAEPSGMICAGRQTNLYLVLLPATDLATVTTLLAHVAEDRPALLVVDSRHGLGVAPGADAAPGLRETADGGWRYVETTSAHRRLAICGGGHCGAALARLMAGLGWHVTVFETRPEVAATGLDDVTVRIVTDFRDAAAALPHPEVTPLVVMTTDVPNDVRALEGALGHGGLPFVGLMGAPAKLEEIRHRLRRRGLGDAALATLTAPVGLPIGSRTPGEIAVSVAAQLLAERHHWLARRARLLRDMEVGYAEEAADPSLDPSWTEIETEGWD